uniref:Uncharacterized protein n=1 Tax=Panagrolaimus superbus TaxID=310955 RepID=A0A914Y937_9BILA
MKPVPLKNKDEIFEEVVKQLRRLIMSDQYTVEWLENESRQETEYPIQELAVQAGYQTTKEFLHEEFYDYVEFVDSQSIRAGPDLYDFNDEVMKDCLSLHARTVPKIRRGRGGNYGGGGGGRAGIPDYRNSQPSSSRAPLNRQQQPSNYSSMNFRQRSPPFIRNRSSPSPPIQTPFTRKRSPLSVIPPNFVEQSSLIHCSSSNIMAGPPPGFENPEKSHRQINIDSTEAYDNIQASSVYPPSSVSDDDPFDVKTVKIINGASCNNSSPDHRPPPDPKNARFEEAEKKLQTFIPSPPGYSIPQEPAVKTLASNKYESFEDEEEFFDALDDPQLMKLPACLSKMISK